MSSNEVKDETNDHTYFTIIQNVLLKMGLSSSEFHAYSLLKMTAGDRGSCFKSNKTIAKEMGCSTHKVIEVKRSLENRGLICVKKRWDANGSRMPDLITIVDIWKLNIDTKGGSAKSAPGGVVQNLHHPSAKSAHKQDPLEEDPLKQTNKQPPKPEPLKKEEPVLFVCSSEEEKEKHELLSKHFSAKAMISLMKYSLEQIKQALLTYEDSARNRKIDNPAGYIVRALENGWKPPLSREDTKETNKQYAMKFREKKIGNIEVNCAANHVEIMSEMPYKTYFNKKYNDEGFMEKFNSSLKQCGFIE